MSRNGQPSSPRVGGRMHQSWDDLNHAHWKTPWPDTVIRTARSWALDLYTDGTDLMQWVDNSTIADDYEKRDRYVEASQSFFGAAQFLNLFARELEDKRLELSSGDLEELVGDRLMYYLHDIEKHVDCHVPYQARRRWRMDSCDHEGHWTFWESPSYPSLEEHRHCRNCGFKDVRVVET